MVQESSRVFRVRIINDSEQDCDESASRLASELSAIVGERCEVTVHWVDVLPTQANGKTRMVISKVAR